MPGQKRFLPNNEFLAATNSPTQATLANPFVTVADLASIDTSIYLGDGSLISNREVDLGTFDLNFALSDNNGRFSVGPVGFIAARNIHFKCFGANPLRIEGFNDTASSRSLDVINDSGDIALEIFNDSDINMALLAVATAARVRMGTTVSQGNAKLTVRGVNQATGNVAIYVGGSSGTRGMAVNNDDRWGLGALGTAATKANIRGQGTGTNITLALADFNGINNFRQLDNGLLLLATAGSGGIGLGQAKVFGVDKVLTADEDNTLAYFENNFAPTVSASRDAYAVQMSTFKTTANNCFSVIGAFAEGRNDGTGDITELIGIRAQARSGTAALIDTAFAVEAQLNIFAGSTALINEAGGINIRFGANLAGTNIGDMLGVVVRTPTNTGGTVAATYAFKAEENTVGTVNYGIKQFGTSMLNEFEGHIESLTAANGYIWVAPNGDRIRVTIDNDHELVFSAPL